MTRERCDGILLAAGAGTRYGMPKVLAENGSWLDTAVAALRDGGCDRIFVVLGATGPAHPLPPGNQTSEPRWLVAQTPRIVLPEGTRPVWAADWETGLSASIRAGLAAVSALAVRTAAARKESTGIIDMGITSTGNTGPADLVAIMPVDTPDVRGDVVARVVAAARDSESRLARAVFAGLPGHPVVLGREHWAGVVAAAEGNSGAGTYLRQRADMVCVTCDDLATGIDWDYPGGGTR
ncbi:nucleotidyltransferase family protein [Nocardia huaxiensis]|uniref:NTP transferase domain-containing protein n=1 Tax=Nocardia huaxiensis TaxID=2755382 RepID=A0A7D6VBD3_9NOCA|nr:NTP transferase domain-containing protein [Nocardia huaxiensis]QLY32201.1 NTP transferase domain-containing protein [Nocardia huaxiensis]UFS94096.1 NTP transferase domain-containing protein [Nocardia huaxiensis]